MAWDQPTWHHFSPRQSPSRNPCQHSWPFAARSLPPFGAALGKGRLVFTKDLWGQAMPAEGLCGAGFTSPSGIVYLATLVHQGSPLACGCSGPGKAEASPQLSGGCRVPSLWGRRLQERVLFAPQQWGGCHGTCSRRSWAPRQPVVPSPHQDSSVARTPLPQDARFTCFTRFSA